MVVGEVPRPVLRDNPATGERGERRKREERGLPVDRHTSTGRGEAREEEDAVPYGMRDIQSDWWSKYYIMYYEMQRCAVLREEGWTWQFRWSIPTPGSGNECEKHVDGGVESKNCEK